MEFVLSSDARACGFIGDLGYGLKTVQTVLKTGSNRTTYRTFT
jgi:hypothetical protein